MSDINISVSIKNQGGMNGAGSGSDSKDTVLLIADGGKEYGEVQFRVSKTMKLGKLMTAFCRRFEVDESILKFLYDGDRIKRNNTPKELGMQNGDHIDVNQTQDGGGIITSGKKKSETSLTVKGVQKF